VHRATKRSPEIPGLSKKQQTKNPSTAREVTLADLALMTVDFAASLRKAVSDTKSKRSRIGNLQNVNSRKKMPRRRKARA
jgi:hypothetical protein